MTQLNDKVVLWRLFVGGDGGFLIRLGCGKAAAKRFRQQNRRHHHEEDDGPRNHVTNHRAVFTYKTYTSKVS